MLPMIILYGFSAFSEAYNGGGVVHYGTQHLRYQKNGDQRLGQRERVRD